MPSAATILEQLTQLANTHHGIAFFWHVATLLALGVLAVAPWRPRGRVAAWLTVAPVVSAALLAFDAGNPFNATVLGVVSVALGGLAATLPPGRVTRGPAWTSVVGGAAIAFALAYPHFVPLRSPAYLLIVPTGVVPCPSLALTLGFALLAGGFGSRAWALTAAGAGAFYALFGMFRLGVWLDAGLLLAAVALAFTAVRRPGHAAVTRLPGSLTA